MREISVVTYCKTTVKYHNRILTLLQSTSLFRFSHLLLSVCVCGGGVYSNHLGRVVYAPPQQDTEQLQYHKNFSCCSFITTPASMLSHPTPVPNSWHLCSISKFSLSKCYTNEIIQYITFRDSFVHSVYYIDHVLLSI